MKPNSKLYFLFCLLLCLFLLSSCGVPNGKTEAEISADLEIQLDDLKEANVSISSLEVTKRQTNKDEKTERVFVTTVLENELIRLVRSYDLHYNYFDEGGWTLEKIIPLNTSEWTCVPKHSNDITEARVKNDVLGSSKYSILKSSVDDLILNDMQFPKLRDEVPADEIDLILIEKEDDLGNLKCNVTFTIKSFSSVIEISETLLGMYLFDEKTFQWVYANAEELSYNLDLKKDLCGTFNGKDQFGYKSTLTICSINNDGTLTGKYENNGKTSTIKGKIISPTLLSFTPPNEYAIECKILDNGNQFYHESSAARVEFGDTLYTKVKKLTPQSSPISTNNLIGTWISQDDSNEYITFYDEKNCFLSPEEDLIYYKIQGNEIIFSNTDGHTWETTTSLSKGILTLIDYDDSPPEILEFIKK